MNPLSLLPAKVRAAVYILALIVGVATPFVVVDVSGVWEHALQALMAVAALFASAQGLSNLTADSENYSIQARRAMKTPEE